jgi:hypothetical protein
MATNPEVNANRLDDTKIALHDTIVDHVSQYRELGKSQNGPFDQTSQPGAGNALATGRSITELRLVFGKKPLRPC